MTLPCPPAVYSTFVVYYVHEDAVFTTELWEDRPRALPMLSAASFLVTLDPAVRWETARNYCIACDAGADLKSVSRNISALIRFFLPDQIYSCNKIRLSAGMIDCAERWKMIWASSMRAPIPITTTAAQESVDEQLFNVD